jgi:NADH-quinone oxidoreductase subunit J
MNDIFFYLLGFLALTSSLLMIISKNTMYSVLFLLVTFFCVAGLMLLLNAQFLAMVNVIVYAGAIMVLFLYVLMFLNFNTPMAIRKNLAIQIAAFIGGGLVFLTLFAALITSRYVEAPTETDDSIGSIEKLGSALFNEFLLPFELSSVLFISAMVGAIILTKKEARD